jgi:outer membrane receptor protein involved in Fe transport
MVNIPITENLFFRGNYANESSDGYYFNNFSAFNSDTGGTDSEALGLALRWLVNDNWTVDFRASFAQDRDQNRGGSCRARPGESLYNTLKAGEPTNTVNPGAFFGPDGVAGGGDDVFYTGPGPFTENAAGNWGGARLPADGGLRIDAIYSGANAQWLNDCEANAAAGDFVTTQNMNTGSFVDNDMYTLDVTWDSEGPIGMFENASVQFKFADRENSYRYQQDRDFGQFTIDHIGNAPFPEAAGILRKTQEIEVIFNADVTDTVNVTLGAYYFDDVAGAPEGNKCIDRWNAIYDPFAVAPGSTKQGTINGLEDFDLVCQPEGGTFFNRLPDTSQQKRSFTNQGRTTGESKAIYGHVAWNITEAWELGIGFRAMEDKRTQTHMEGGILNGTCTHNNPGDASPLEMCRPTFLWNRSTLIEDGVTYKGGQDFSETTGLASLSYHLTPNDTLDSGMIYATYSEGYLHGAFNDEIISTNGTAAQNAARRALIPYGAEFVTNYELGFKGTFLDGRLRLNADVFLMDYTDKQEAISIDNPDGTLGPDSEFEYTVNAGNIEITGIELELRAELWAGGFLTVDGGLLDNNYKSFLLVDILDPTAAPKDNSGQAIDNLTPDWTLTASLEHVFQLSSGATITPQLGLYLQDEQERLNGLNEEDGLTSTHCHQDSYAKWRVRATYQPPEGNWHAALYGYNITDERVINNCANVRSGAYRVQYQAPSQWGVEFRMNFG